VEGGKGLRKDLRRPTTEDSLESKLRESNMEFKLRETTGNVN